MPDHNSGATLTLSVPDVKPYHTEITNENTPDGKDTFFVAFLSDKPLVMNLSTTKMLASPQNLVPSGAIIDSTDCHLSGEIFNSMVSKTVSLSFPDNEYVAQNELKNDDSNGAAYTDFFVIGELGAQVRYHTESDPGFIQSATETIPFNFRIILHAKKYAQVAGGMSGITVSSLAFKPCPESGYYLDDSGNKTYCHSYPWTMPESAVGSMVQISSSDAYFNPSSTTISDDYQATFEPVVSIGRVMESDEEIPISVTVDGKQVKSPSLKISLGEVLSKEGDVVLVDPFGAEQAAMPGMKVAPGAKLVGTNSRDPFGNIVYPAVNIRFSNGVEQYIRLTDDYGQPIVAVLGNTGVDAIGKKKSYFDLMLNDFVFNIENNPKVLVQYTVKKAFGFLAGNLTGGASWLARKATGTVVEYGIQSYSDYSSRNKQYKNLQLSKNTIIKDQLSATNEYLKTSSATPGEDYLWTLLSDGSVRIENYGPSLILSSSDGNEIFVPQRTQRTLGPDGIPKEIQLLYKDYRTTATTPIPMSITPGNGTLVSRTPEIKVQIQATPGSLTNYLHDVVALRKGSVACWINGINIGPQMVMDDIDVNKAYTFYYAVPPEGRLKEGDNTIEFYGEDDLGFFHRINATFTATGTPEVPRDIMVFQGCKNAVVRWAPNREEDIAGYRIYRASSNSGPWEVIGNTSEPVFTDFSPSEGAWYSVLAYDTGGIESDWSGGIQIKPLYSDSSLVPTASTPGLAVTPKNNSLLIELTEISSNNALWKLEKSINGSAFQSIVDNGQSEGFMGRTAYTDNEVQAGSEYRYRLTPYNGDIIGGSPVVSEIVTPFDQAPSPPGGFSIYADYETPRVTLRWNPSSDHSCTGYNIYMKTDTGEFQQVAALPASKRQYSLEIGDFHVYYFAICSTDNLGRIGERSKRIEISKWYPRPGARQNSFSWTLFLPAIIGPK